MHTPHVYSIFFSSSSSTWKSTMYLPHGHLQRSAQSWNQCWNSKLELKITRPKIPYSQSELTGSCLWGFCVVEKAFCTCSEACSYIWHLKISTVQIIKHLHSSVCSFHVPLKTVLPAEMYQIKLLPPLLSMPWQASSDNFFPTHIICNKLFMCGYI